MTRFPAGNRQELVELEYCPSIRRSDGPVGLVRFGIGLNAGDFEGLGRAREVVEPPGYGQRFGRCYRGRGRERLGLDRARRVARVSSVSGASSCSVDGRSTFKTGRCSACGVARAVAVTRAVAADVDGARLVGVPDGPVAHGAVGRGGEADAVRVGQPRLSVDAYVPGINRPRTGDPGAVAGTDGGAAFPAQGSSEGYLVSGPQRRRRSRNRRARLRSSRRERRW